MLLIWRIHNLAPLFSSSKEAQGVRGGSYISTGRAREKSGVRRGNYHRTFIFLVAVHVDDVHIIATGGRGKLLVVMYLVIY